MHEAHQSPTWEPIPEDPYEALGVSSTSTKAEITDAFRRLSLKYHPDKNKGDHDAEEWFRAISEARDILLNPHKNRRGSYYFKSFNPGSANTYRAETAKEKQARKNKEAEKRAAEAAEKMRKAQAEQEKRRAAEEKERAEQARQRAEEERIKEAERLKNVRIDDIKARIEANRKKEAPKETFPTEEERIAEIQARIEANRKKVPPERSAGRDTRREEIEARIKASKTQRKNSV